jgi:hypothetical protein
LTISKIPAPPTLPLRCPERSWTAGLLRAREADVLSRDDRRLLQVHLAACGECRSAALSLDPTLLFAPMAGPSGDTAAGEGRKMAADVRAVLEAQRIDQRIRRPRVVLPGSFNMGHPALKAAALLLFGAGLAGLVSLRPWEDGGQAPARVAAMTPGADANARDLHDLHDVRVAAAIPFIDGVESPGAKVYQFAAEVPGQPAVVFVVDRNADL